jgi:hypothetical protein
MADRPSQLWKDMPLEKRVLAAEAFWRDEDSPDIQVQQMEAVVALARRLNFRTRSIQALPVDRRARHLAQMGDVSESVATRALIAYHFMNQRPLMASFLDALGIAHEDGLITEENVQAPAREKLAAAVTSLKASFDPGDVNLYLRTLAALDGETWANMDGVLNG